MDDSNRFNDNNKHMVNRSFPSTQIDILNFFSTNCRQMMRDERYFCDPEEFRPTRYLDANKDGATSDLLYDPGKLVFGFGRRFVHHISLKA